MAEINILTPHLADMIAAGEVVERPASIIKELVENSFDAHARNITVEVRGGGATYLRVSDDGCGMSAEDAGIAFLRHATSKLHTEADLEHIATMGFRGEALAAISAVSRVELTTRKKGASEGIRVVLEAGEIQDMHPCGCPEGTTMVVRDVFFNTPARLKFLKSDRSEAQACAAAALRCALAHPEVSVKLIRDGTEEFFSPGDGREDSCIYTLLGRELASTLLPCRSKGENMAVHGFVSSPSAGRGSRGAQYFFCNGRYIRSALLQAAVEQAYKNTLLTGRYPACVLYLDLSFASVDVNVHPAKTEVKFTDEKKVFDLVYYAVLSVLEEENRTAAVVPSVVPARTAAVKSEPKKDFYVSMSASEYRERSVSPTHAVKSASGSYSAPTVRREREPMRLSSPTGYVQTSLDLSGGGFAVRSVEKLPEHTDTPIVEKSVESVEIAEIPAKSPTPALSAYRIIGEALKTYIIVEQGDELIWIDKHACHERIIFDRLKAHKREIMSQTLLTPVPFRPSIADAELLAENDALLSELGFEISAFGERDLMIRAVPYDMNPGDVTAALEEICEKLHSGRTIDPSAVRDEILHTVACKAAIKAGWDTTEPELAKLVEKVLSGEVKYCPHGRPVSQVMTHRELDKLFRRIV